MSHLSTLDYLITTKKVKDFFIGEFTQLACEKLDKR